MAPKVVTATDEQDLAKQLERAEQENAEVIFWLEFFFETFFDLLFSLLIRCLETMMMRTKNRLEWVEKYPKVKKVTRMKKIKVYSLIEHSGNTSQILLKQ